jgi:hypothetical protein
LRLELSGVSGVSGLSAPYDEYIPHTNYSQNTSYNNQNHLNHNTDLDPFPATGIIELKRIIDENIYQNMNKDELSDNIGENMNVNKNIVTHMDLRKLIDIVFHVGNERDSIVRIAGHFIVGLFCYICSFLLFVRFFFFTYALLAVLRFTLAEDRFLLTHTRFVILV